MSFSCFFIPATFAQTAASDGKKITNAISFNIGQYLVNEINLGYEYFLSEKKSIEVNGGIIYSNEFWKNVASEWTNSQYFRENGFAVRAYYKTYKKASEKSHNKSFYSFGLNYQYLYFNNQWIETDKRGKVKPEGDTVSHFGPEEILMHRLRHRIGLQLMLGNVIAADKTFALEIYYGLGIRGIFSNRFDVARRVTEDGEIFSQELNYEDKSFYVRPTIHAGVKLKLGW